MFGMSMTEIMVILLIALVFMGPEKIPEAARFVGKMLREVRKASNLLRDAVMVDEERSQSIRPQPLQTADSPPPTGDEVAMRDPDPTLDVRLAQMNPTRSPTESHVRDIPLEIATADLRHREVYLHVPYDETI